MLRQLNRAAEGQPDLLVSKRIPLRPPGVPPNLIDLTGQYNLALQEETQRNQIGYNLLGLPVGVQKLGGVPFDVRGAIQLLGAKPFRGGLWPDRVEGIAVGQPCRRLHFLHGTRTFAVDGKRIGTYTVHYADGQEQKIPIVYGEDLRELRSPHEGKKLASRAPVAWTGLAAAGDDQRLFMLTWENPRRTEPISHIDFVALADAMPLLVALTAE